MTLTFHRDPNNSRIIELQRDGQKVGVAWFPVSEQRWCWSLHGDGQPIETGADESESGACTDLVAAYWRHVDDKVAFPEAA